MSVSPIGWLVALVAVLLAANRAPWSKPITRWLPLPLWCYILPMAASALGWIPRDAPGYRVLTTTCLPFALALLLFGVHLPSVLRVGSRALASAAIGAAGVVLGAPAGFWLLRHHLSPEAWKGAGALAGTWTGGTMNLLALRTALEIPEPVFAPLIVVDAVIAYGWMALLVAASAFEPACNRWLRAEPWGEGRGAGGVLSVECGMRNAECRQVIPQSTIRNPLSGERPARKALFSTLLAPRLATATLALALTGIARELAARLPVSPLVTSASSWTVLLVTSASLGLSCAPAIRRVSGAGSGLGQAALYLVLAAAGAQARLDALWSSPAWLALGVCILGVHGAALLAAGRLLRVPLGVLATASQANIGGVISAPLVGAVYHRSLAPVGLLLAMAGNALGTYLGWVAALLCRSLAGP